MVMMDDLLTPQQCTMAAAAAAAAGLLGAAWLVKARAAAAAGAPGPTFTLPLVGETPEFMRDGPLRFFWSRCVARVGGDARRRRPLTRA